MLAALVFVKSALQRAGIGKRSYSYEFAFPVAMRSDNRAHTPGFHASPIDVVFAPSIAHLTGKVKDSTTFWEVAKRLQQDSEKECRPSKLTQQMSLTSTFLDDLRPKEMPRGFIVDGDVSAVNLGRWPYKETSFPAVDILAYRLNQTVVPGTMAPGITMMWLGALPNGAHTWSAQYARPAFASRDAATDFVEAFGALVLDLPTREGDVKIGEWIDSLVDDSPFMQYVARVKEAEAAGKL